MTFDAVLQAYISLSLDCTGLLRYMAFWVSLKGGTSGRRLYLFFFLFFFFFGVIVGNVSRCRRLLSSRTVL
jgi:Na+/H+ antiporter NhaD/arsenite permease-like protein